MKPSLPKGTRDFLPAEVVRRKYMFSTIEEVFVKYGYVPIETPTMESLETLAGKYGEEGDRLLFKILNNGDFLKKADEQALNERNSNKLVPSISRRGLRYDLTVPFARYVVMHRNDLPMPFKRYQIQPVWRADRPQKGRYQEFYQCDVDVVGSRSLVYEAEFVQIYDEIFSRLALPVTIRLNHRKVLAGIAETCGIGDQLIQMTSAIDKLDKIGVEGVLKELVGRGIDPAQAEQVMSLLEVSDLDILNEKLSGSATGQAGVADLKQVFSFLQGHELTNPCRFDIKLARGLDYYTGCIFEVDLEHPEIRIGSLGGGGRYDDLTGVFGMPDLPGVGISFGAARIYDVLEQIDGFPEDLHYAPQLLFLPLDDTTMQMAFGALTKVRAAGIAADMYPEPAKLKKQLKYADAISVPYAVICGPEELERGEYMLKDMRSGDQQHYTLPDLIRRIT